MCLHRQNIVSFALSFWLILTSSVLDAQAPPAAETPAEDTPTPSAAEPAETAVDSVQGRLESLQKSVEASTDLEESQKTEISTLIQQAQSDLTAAAEADQQAQQSQQRAAAIEQELADLESKLAMPVPPVTIDSGQPVTELESERVETQAEIARLEQELKKPTVDAAARSARRKEARTRVTELPATLSDIEQQLETPVPEGTAPLLAEARKLALEAQKRSVQARMNAAQKELAQYDAADAVNLPTMRKESSTRQLSAAQKRLEALTEAINRQRQAEAERRAREAEQAKADVPKGLEEKLEESQAVIRTEQDVRNRHEEARKLLQQATDRTTEINDNFAEAKRLDKDIGLEKMGVWLRNQREKLQEGLDALDKQLTEHTKHLVDAEVKVYERENQLEALTDIEARADELTAQAERAGTTNLEQFRKDAVQVLRSHRLNLDKLVDEYRAYTETLVDLDVQHQELTKAADEYAAFLDERIFWVRSHLPLTLAQLREEGETLHRIIDPQTWLMTGKAIAWDAVDHLLLYGSVVLVLLFLWTRRYRHGKQLDDIAKQASGRVTTAMAPTIHCLVLTIWLAIPWPGLILFLAWRLHESSISTGEQQVAAINLARLASVAFLLEFVRQSCRRNGLAEAHFGWNGKTLRRVRRLLWTVLIFGLPFAAAVACLHQQDPGSRSDSIERLFFAGAMVVLALFAHGLLHPTKGALRQARALQNGGWLDRLDYLWYVLGVGIPLALAGFGLLGYYDTAVKLAMKVQQTAWIVLIGIYLHALALRWLMLRHRRLRIAQARERLAAAQSEAQASPEAGAMLPEVEPETTDLESISQQSRRLVSTSIIVLALGGLWLLWADVLPAIRFFDRWPLWHTTIQETVTDVDETTEDSIQRTVYKVQAITMANVIQALIIIALTTIATRNIPGMLEISVLQRLPIDRSTAYAVTSLTRYALVLLGLVLASQVLGIGWSKVQWLAAALTFGLGFGLQEIFANFVSGLIILFEQPVRVGDIVTIGDVSGVVNRIRIRATTIVDWDRKEFIVPNREFITGRLLNWTLSDKMNRVVINVGVAYGSDTDLVRTTIMQLLEEHENVLDEPAPLVTFEAFGDSSLNFVVRAYLPNLDERLETIHQLHTAIHQRLAAAGIEIPFPQRDLHMRTNVVLDDSRTIASSGNGQVETSVAEMEESGSE